jgi:hypothetical protein
MSILTLNSERKFKEKIKEWKFEKNLSTEEAKFIATKAKAREEQGKDTTFYKHGIEIDQKRIEKFVKRKREEFDELEDFIARMYWFYISLTALIHGIATPDQITYSTPAPLEDGDCMLVFQDKNKGQMVLDPIPQKLDSFPNFPQATGSNDPSWTPSGDGNDIPVLPAQINGEEKTSRKSNLDTIDAPSRSTPEKSQYLRKIFDESDLYHPDSFREIEEGTESDRESEMGPFDYISRSLEGVDFLEYVALKGHRSHENRVTDNTNRGDKTAPPLFDENDEVRGETENPMADEIPDEETERAAWAHKAGWEFGRSIGRVFACHRPVHSYLRQPISIDFENTLELGRNLSGSGPLAVVN